MISISVAGLGALVALFSFRWQQATRVLKVVVLLVAITSGGLMVKTAHLGGQIRHTEIRNDAIVQNSNEKGGDNEGNAGQQKETDDD